VSLPVERRRDAGYRRDALWAAALIHRVSGILLACFLPLHFLALGLAIEGEAALGGFLRWTQTTGVKLAEMGLVFLLTVHLLGGIRVLLIENLPWRPGQKRAAVTAILVATLIAAFFVVRII
jgi:succinate dehydrogenase subunit D